MNNLIIGYGEIGSRLWRILKKGYSNTDWLDTGRGSDSYMPSKDYEVLNICIPYSDAFEKIVIEYINHHKPRLVVIWSTIGPMTCRSIQRHIATKENDAHEALIVHCPLLIVELSIEGSIRACDQIMGYDDNKAKEAGIRYLRQCFKVHPVKGTATAAIGKLLSTTQYALMVAFNQEMEQMCNHLKVDYNVSVREVTRLYNAGYNKLGLDQYIRPLLYPGIIGGHCQLPNIEILQKIFKSKFLDVIKETNEQYKKKNM